MSKIPLYLSIPKLQVCKQQQTTKLVVHVCGYNIFIQRPIQTKLGVYTGAKYHYLFVNTEIMFVNNNRQQMAMTSLYNI